VSVAALICPACPRPVCCRPLSAMARDAHVCVCLRATERTERSLARTRSVCHANVICLLGWARSLVVTYVAQGLRTVACASRGHLRHDRWRGLRLGGRQRSCRRLRRRVLWKAERLLIPHGPCLLSATENSGVYCVRYRRRLEHMRAVLGAYGYLSYADSGAIAFVVRPPSALSWICAGSSQAP
jgi:hypothetical protein